MTLEHAWSIAHLVLMFTFKWAVAIRLLMHFDRKENTVVTNSILLALLFLVLSAELPWLK